MKRPGLFKGARGLRAPAPAPKSHSEYYRFFCLHCKETIFARVSFLWGVFGRILECPCCHGQIRVFKRTHAFTDLCKQCDKRAICMATPLIQVGTGTNIKRKKYPTSETSGRIMVFKSEIC